MSKECEEGEVQGESKKHVFWLEDGERFLADVHWSGNKSQSFINQTFIGSAGFSSCSTGSFCGALHMGS